MALAIGSRIAGYEITGPLGAGGMGEVYRARDTKLGREVALKILPAEFAVDPERLARFTREAQVLASLNHPHIAAIYGFEDGDGPPEGGHYVRALVLELVDGPTLADRIAQGRLAIDEALPIARQIAEALEAAHEQGIIHRDLKPANIKVRPDGTVKVLDFGLAKLIEADGPPKGGPYVHAGSAKQDPAYTVSPTITTPAMTQIGMIMGTAAYMSPEQAKGRVADKRSDIWAFGCVLFEMLTGRRAFDGEDVSDTLAAVLRAEPEWTSLPTDTPDRIHGLVRRCLRKDPQKRLPHIAMARFEIDEASSESPLPPSIPLPSTAAKQSLVRRAMPVVSGVVLASALTSSVWWMLRPQAIQPIVHRLAIVLADGDQLATYPFRALAISRDGTQIVYVANQRLYLRSVSKAEPTVIAGTDAGSPIGTPAFSPDGRSIVFIAARGDFGAGFGSGATLKTISVSGGTPTTIAQSRAGNVPGLSWGEDGIVFSDLDAGVMRIPPGGGKPERLVGLGAGEAIQGPVMLPGGRAVLYSVTTAREVGRAPTLDLWDAASIVVQKLPSGERTTLIVGGSDAQYLPTGHLLYVRGGTAYVAPFDLATLKVGASSPIVEGVARVVSGRASTGAAQLSVSSTGSLAYLEGPASLSAARPKLVIVDRDGKIDELRVAPKFYEHPRVSPDGTQVALGAEDPNSRANNIFIYDLSGKTLMRQLTFDGRNRYPVWSPDGARVAYQSDRDADAAIFVQSSNGSGPPKRLTKPDKDTTHIPESWSADGKYLLYSVTQGATNALWVYSFEANKGAPFGDVRSPRLISGTFSPRGDWVAYTLTSNGQNEVFVQPFPATGSKYLVGNGARPQWSPDGTEVFFYRTDGTFVETVTTRPSFNVSNAVRLPFNVYGGRGPGAGRDADIMPDGKHFVAVVVPDDVAANGRGTNIRQLHVVLNWFEEVKQQIVR